MTRSLQIPVKWGRLSARVQGPANGRRFLFLHGWLDNLASFDPLLRELPPSWRCVSLDLAGHGRSDHRPVGTSYHLVDSITDLWDVVQFLKWNKFTLVGHSLGAALAALYAGTFSDSLEALVLFEALGPLASGPEETRSRTAEYCLRAAELPKKKMPVYKSVDQAALARQKAGDLSFEAARLIVERNLRKTTRGYSWRSDPRLRLPSLRFTEDQVRGFLAGISCPTFCLITDNGLVVQMPNWQQRAEKIKNLTLIRQPGGHHFHLEEAAASAKVLMSWMEPGRAHR